MCSEIYFSASPLYMFRAAHTPIIRSTISTVSTGIGTIHSRSQIVSVTSSQRSLARTDTGELFLSISSTVIWVEGCFKTRCSSELRKAVYIEPRIGKILVTRVLVGSCFAGSCRLISSSFSELCLCACAVRRWFLVTPLHATARGKQNRQHVCSGIHGMRCSNIRLENSVNSS